jgi:hypothetical protein
MTVLALLAVPLSLLRLPGAAGLESLFFVALILFVILAAIALYRRFRSANYEESRADKRPVPVCRKGGTLRGLLSGKVSRCIRMIDHILPSPIRLTACYLRSARRQLHTSATKVPFVAEQCRLTDDNGIAGRHLDVPAERDET